MKEIIKITASLTAVCVAAALILGAVYAKTQHARKQIEAQMKEETRLSLLGFGGDRKRLPISRSSACIGTCSRTTRERPFLHMSFPSRKRDMCWPR